MSLVLAQNFQKSTSKFVEGYILLPVLMRNSKSVCFQYIMQIAAARPSPLCACFLIFEFLIFQPDLLILLQDLDLSLLFKPGESRNHKQCCRGGNWRYRNAIYFINVWFWNILITVWWIIFLLLLTRMSLLIKTMK